MRFTPAMFARMQQSLNTYRRTTPAWPTASAAAALAANYTASYARPLQKCVENELRQARVENELRESLRPAAERVDREIQRQRRIRARQLARQRAQFR